MRIRTRRRILFALLSTAGLLLMAEAAVSVLGKRALLAWEAPVPVTQTGAPYLPGNPYLLWEMVPGSRTEVGVEVHVNTLGFRGPEITENKSQGVRRILILGDSTVYGHGVADDKVFAQVLNQSLGPNVEVINLGVPGYSTEQTLNLMDMRGWQLSPDLIIIANLWSDNNFDSFVDKTIISRQLDAETPWALTVSGWLKQSALYRWLDWHVRLEPRANEVKTVGWMLGRTPTGGYRRVSVNDYAGNLQLLVDKSRSRNADVLFLAFANSVDVGAQTDGAIAWPLYREVMATVARTNGAPLVEVESVYQASKRPWTDLFIDEMHPSEAGHKLIANALESAIQPWQENNGFDLNSSNEPLPTWDDPFARGEGPPLNQINTAQITLTGSIVGAPSGVPVQIDLIDLSQSRPNSSNPMVGSARFDHVDTFEMPAPGSGEFGIKVYLDREGDGPSSDDTVFTFDTTIKATGKSIDGLIINLHDRSLGWTTPNTTSASPR